MEYLAALVLGSVGLVLILSGWHGTQSGLLSTLTAGASKAAPAPTASTGTPGPPSKRQPTNSLRPVSAVGNVYPNGIPA